MPVCTSVRAAFRKTNTVTLGLLLSQVVCDIPSHNFHIQQLTVCDVNASILRAKEWVQVVMSCSKLKANNNIHHIIYHSFLAISFPTYADSFEIRYNTTVY